MSENDPIPYVLVDRPPRRDDRVRVEFEAQYVCSSSSIDGCIVEFELPGYPDWRATVPVDSITVLEPPAKRCDVIHATQAARLPESSLVYCIFNNVVYRRSPDSTLRSLHLNSVLNPENGGDCIVLRVGR